MIVTTDHGQQDLDYPSPLSHGGPSELERTSFVFAAGPGIAAGGATRVPAWWTSRPPCCTSWGWRCSPAWNLDGRSFVAGGPPPGGPAASVRLRSRRADAGAGRRGGAAGARRWRPCACGCPAAWRCGRGTRARVDGRRVGRARLKVARRALRITLPPERRRLLVRVPLRRLPRTLPRIVAATVAEAGDEPLDRRIAVRARR